MGKRDRTRAFVQGNATHRLALPCYAALLCLHAPGRCQCLRCRASRRCLLASCLCGCLRMVRRVWIRVCQGPQPALQRTPGSNRLHLRGEAIAPTSPTTETESHAHSRLWILRMVRRVWIGVCQGPQPALQRRTKRVQFHLRGKTCSKTCLCGCLRMVRRLWTRLCQGPQPALQRTRGSNRLHLRGEAIAPTSPTTETESHAHSRLWILRMVRRVWIRVCQGPQPALQRRTKRVQFHLRGKTCSKTCLCGCLRM